MRLIIAILLYFHFSLTPFLYASSENSNFTINTCEINAEPESIFEYHFNQSIFSKLEINGNCISIFSNKPWAELNHAISDIFNCRDCFSFIHRSDLEHSGLHRDKEGLENDHSHIKHKGRKNISAKNLDYMLRSLYKRNLISIEDYNACTESFDSFRVSAQVDHAGASAAASQS